MTSYRYSIWSYGDKSDIQTFELECDNFIHFKSRFLKRFGNHRAKNKAERDRRQVKIFVYTSPNIEVMVTKINRNTNWNVEIIKDGKLVGEPN